MQITDTTDTVNRAPVHGVRRCLSVVARHYGLKPAELRERDRRRQIVRPRQLAMWLAYQLKTYSLDAIGHHLGGYDHTTVLHAVRSIEQRRKDEAYRQVSDALLRQVRQVRQGSELGLSFWLSSFETTAPPRPRAASRVAPPAKRRPTRDEKVEIWREPVSWYGDCYTHQHDRRARPGYLVEQNERFLAAMREACE